VASSGKDGGGGTQSGVKVDAKPAGYDFTKKASANMEKALEGTMFK
jgi:hypothetical protein